ncbi:PAS domain-containing protein [Szabonella alba]|uniref:histidine kinase n=1 Tax=Szabonella alba TaxID=2804194 RepID=A0A8K0VCT4_9RHOB|nr:PAS domain-containing protein [Szabonella alba]MBL4916932.1 PAS domain-containing protein [Szabonella alba]
MRSAIDGIIWRADADTLRFSHIDGSVEEILGFTAENWLEQTDFWQSRLHPDDAVRVMETSLAARRARQPHRLSYRMIAADGRVVWLQDNVKVILEEDRATLCGIMIDVTELATQRQDPMTVADQNARYRTLYDLVPVAIWEEDWAGVLDLLRDLRDRGLRDIHDHAAQEPGFVDQVLQHLNVISVNRAAVEMFRADSPEELIRRSSEVFLADRPHSVLLTALDCILNGKTEIEGVNILRRLNGEAVHVMYRISLPHIEDRAARVVICEMDVTAEHISQERFEAVSRASSDVIWDFDIAKDTLWASEGLLRTFGLDPASMFHGLANWTSRIHPQDIDGVMANYDEILTNGEIDWNQTYRFQRADGTYAVVRDVGSVLHDETGRVVRMLGSLSDITDQTDMEERLHQSQKLEAIGQLTGGIAHDFNNLLTVILGSAEELEEQLEQAPRLRKLAEMIASAAERGSELTNRLLAFARKQALEPRLLDLSGHVLGMEGLLRRTLPEHIDIRISVPEAPAQTRVDPGALESALLNLALNARDAMPDGGVLAIMVDNVTLDTEDLDLKPGQTGCNHVMISVTDTGSGIPEDVLDRIFEPFFTTKDVGKGSGLGLSMVYGFVKQSGGQIRAESELGKGTSMMLFFPRSDIAEKSRDARTEPRNAAGGSETILVVEDDALVRQNLTDQLRSLGYRVLTAATAPEALDIICKISKIDLLFTDIVMPGGMDGLQLARAARSLCPKLQVLFTSGYPEHSASDSDCSTLLGDLLGKPYRRFEVASTVRRSLARIHAPAQLTAQNCPPN